MLGTIISVKLMVLLSSWVLFTIVFLCYWFVGMYLAGNTVWTKLSETQGRLDSPQQSHHVQVLNAPPE